MLLPQTTPSQAGASAIPGWPAALAIWGPGGRSDLHAHHAMHLVLRREGQLRARRMGSPWVDAPGVFVAPDVPHEIDASDGQVIILFVEPESDDGLRLRAALGDGLVPLTEELRASLLEPLGGAAFSSVDPASWMRHALSRLTGSVTVRQASHPRVRRVLRHLQAVPPEGDVSLEALARIAGLSPGRFMHAFTESVGVPLRPYLLWHRLKRAAAAIAGGQSVGEAAHFAGFADAAHLTRTFRRMFGTTPSVLQRRSQIVQAPGDG